MLQRAVMNAIELLKQQHEKTREALERMSEGDIDADELRLAADELVAHMVIEEHVFYPRIREIDPDLVKESYEEHAVARFELARVMLAGDDEKEARISVLKELVEQHIEEEENEILPKVERRVSSDELEQLGARMERMFDKAVEAGLEKLVVSGGVDLRAERAAPQRMRTGGGRGRAPAPLGRMKRGPMGARTSTR